MNHKNILNLVGHTALGAVTEWPDIELFKKHTGENVRIKAAGGIHTKEQFEAFATAGVHRIGASVAVKILT